MKTKTLVSLLALLAAWLSTLSLQLSAAPLGTAFTFQGKLTDGGPAANGTYDMRFAIYDLDSGGGVLAGPITNSPVTVSVGLFTTTLDFGSGVFTGEARWLEVGVRTNGSPGGFTTLSPRQALTAAPHALHAERAAVVADGSVRFAQLTPDAVGTVNLQGGAVTSDKIADGTLAAADLGSALLSNTFWRLGGNAGTIPGTHFLGTTDNTSLELQVNNQRALRLQGGPTGPNFVGGLYVNSITQTVSGSFIGGGGVMYGPNSIAANGVFLGGGQANTVRAGADYATLAGGGANDIGLGAGVATIGGGSGQSIGQNSSYAGIFAGHNNVISSNSGSSGILLGGGGRIGESSSFAAILSGEANNIGPTASYAAIASGGANRIESGGSYGFIGGGQANVVRSNSFHAAVLSGGQNSVGPGAPRSVLAGGSGNEIGPGAYNAFLGGGQDNEIQLNAAYAAILGGHGNLVRTNAQWATVLGGQSSTAGAPYTIAGGHQARAEHTGSIVLADGQYGDFASSNANEFAVRAAGGVRFVTGGTGLTVDGAKLTGLGGGLVIPANGVATSNLQAAAVTSDKIADGTIAAADLSPALASNTFWRLDGNAGTTAGTHFLGTTDNQPLEFKVNGLRALRLEDNGDSNDIGTEPDGAPNVVGGSPANFVANGVVGATISGGGATLHGGLGRTNAVLAHFGTVGGGYANRIEPHAEHAVIAGGLHNGISTNCARGVVAGGLMNQIRAHSFDSSIGGGNSNTIQEDSQFAAIGGGYSNNVGTNSSLSTIGGGNRNIVSGNSEYATIAGGVFNEIGTASANSAIGGGRDNHIATDADCATVPGGRSARANSYGQMAYASGQFSSSGDAQSSLYVLRGTTSDATQTEIFLDGASRRMTLPTDAAWTFEVEVVARSDAGDIAGYRQAGVVWNSSGQLFISPAPTEVLFESAAAAGWDAEATISPMDDLFQIKVTGSAGKTVRWVACMRTAEVIH